MAKVQIAVPKRWKADFLSWLQEEQILHLVPVEAEISAASADEIAYQLAQIQSALEFLQRLRAETHTHERRSWRNLFVGKPMASLQELEAVLASLSLLTLLGEIQYANEQLTELAAQAESRRAELDRYNNWRGLALAGHDREDVAAAQQVLVVVTGAEEERFREQIEQIPTALWQEVTRVSAKKSETVYLEVVVHRADTALLEEAITDTTARVVELPLAAEETIADHVRDLTDGLEAATEQRAAVLQTGRQLLQHEHTLQLAYDALLHRQEQVRVGEWAIELPYAFVAAGWLPTTALARFTERLMAVFPEAAVETITPADMEQPPILFHNSKLVAPFEAVTDIYGKPRYSELDPSPALSLFFLAAFGLALTDAGYGLVMMVATWAADHFFRLKRDMRKMVNLLFYAGGATVIIGALTGGWFGLTLEELPASRLRDMLLSIKLVDPVREPMVLLMAAFALGVLQLLFAWGVRGYDSWRKGDRVAAVIDSGAWITLVIGILAWVGGRLGLIPVTWQRLITWLVIANAGLLIATQGRQYKNIFLRLGAGAMSMYGLIGFVSDVLSYSRLLALGLATAIIGLVVNLMGVMAYDMIPVVGVVIAGVVLVVGHIFNLGINTLGAFIHSGRLQFVEFFPKFMEGGGLPYKPFGRVGRYVDNPRDFD